MSISQYIGEHLTKLKKLSKGWSDDRKYYVETDSGEKYLVRVSDREQFLQKRQEFDHLTLFYKEGIPAPQPFEFGQYGPENCVYQLLAWCEGEEAKEVLPSLPPPLQYAYGREAGRILKKMSGIESYLPSNHWADMYGQKTDRYAESYRNCSEKLEGGECLLSFLKEHRSCLRNRPVSLLHTDYQSDNMVISPDSKLTIIDFQESGIVDPYYTLAAVMVSAENCPRFAVGQLDEYFQGPVPDDFWLLNAFYTAAECIHSFAVAVKLGREYVEEANEMQKITLSWYDDPESLIPSWYRKRDLSLEGEK